MTLLASWIGVDTHGPTSAYIVSDSRFSWGTTKSYDYEKKVFASSQYPELFGYAGDVLFPSTVLSQLIEMIDAGILFTPKMTCQQKHAIVYQKLCYSFSKYPTECANKVIQVLHISRDTLFEKYPSFSCCKFSWTDTKGWSQETINVPLESGLLCVLGSGSTAFGQNYKNYQAGINHDTSRNVFHCFINSLFNTTDPYVGGAPQLVGLYRKPGTFGRNYGIVFKNKRYFLGLELPPGVSYDTIEWRNELFELTDGFTKKIIDTATKQPDPFRNK